MFKPTIPVFVSMMTAGVACAENVEVYVVDMLDNIQDGYCLDIAKGRGADANPDNGLQAHTCYSPTGEILVDQAFASDWFADDVLYMPEFDVCVQAAGTNLGASVELAACDGSDAQGWSFAGEGTITPKSAPDVCLTLTGQTRTGRSAENQMIALTLETCSPDLSATQTWSNRTAK